MAKRVQPDDLDFPEIGKTAFVFSTEVPPDRLAEYLKDAANRFEITHEVYKIRVFHTSEEIQRGDRQRVAQFLTIKIEATCFRAAAWRMSRAFGFLALLDFGLRSGEDFEIDTEARHIELLQSKQVFDRRSIYRQPLVNYP